MAADERGKITALRLQPVAGRLHEIHLVRTRLQRRPRIELDAGFAPQYQRPAQIRPRWKLHCPAGSAAYVQGLLDGHRVKNLALAGRAQVANIKRGGAQGQTKAQKDGGNSHWNTNRMRQNLSLRYRLFGQRGLKKLHFAFAVQDVPISGFGEISAGLMRSK